MTWRFAVQASPSRWRLVAQSLSSPSMGAQTALALAIAHNSLQPKVLLQELMVRAGGLFLFR